MSFLTAIPVHLRLLPVPGLAVDRYIIAWISWISHFPVQNVEEPPTRDEQIVDGFLPSRQVLLSVPAT